MTTINVRLPDTCCSVVRQLVRTGASPSCTTVGPPMKCQDIIDRCPKHRELVNKELSACKTVLDWDGQGTPPMCPSACMNITRAIQRLPNARQFACCDCGEGLNGMFCKMAKMKLEAACGVCMHTFWLVLENVCQVASSLLRLIVQLFSIEVLQVKLMKFGHVEFDQQKEA